MLVIVGLGGDHENAERFHRWASAIVDAAKDRYALPPDSIVYLGEDPARDKARISGRSTRDAVDAAVTRLAAQARPGDRVFIVLIGHGASATGEARFNLPGPDLAAPDFARLAGRFAAQQVVFVNTASASGGFVAALSGKDRTVITATRTEGERNQTRFGEFFAEALSTGDADMDKDGRVSMLEAFNWARLRVAESYERDGQLLTEHAMLDDDGDGKGTAEPGQPGGDGAMARTLFLSAGGHSARARRRYRPRDSRARGAASGARGTHHRPEGVQGEDRPGGVRERTGAAADRIGPHERGHQGEGEAMRRALTIAIGLVAAVAIAAGAAALQQAPPQQQPQGTVRLPSIQFPPPQGPQPMLPGQGGRRQLPPFMGLERDRGEPANLEVGQVAYDGRFTFARLRYTQGVAANELGSGRFGRRGGGRGQGPPWSHDYPRAERNFMKILDEITTIGPYTGLAGGVILDIGSPDIMKFPVSYMAEAGYWTQTDEEAANLRAYLLKGGFIIFDDFRGGDWDNFDAQMKRVLPDVRMVELDITHPIFHAFFDVATLDFVQFYGRGEKPLFIGAYEDNDPSKRLLFIANYNNDVGEYWEFSDTGWTPIDLSNEAYKLGVNYIVYALTH